MTRLVAVLAVAWAGTVAAHPDGAPPAHTGGFGEPSCHACHFDAPVEEAGLRIEGLPDRFAPGERYELELVLEHAELRTAGFQLAVRDTDGRQAGSVEPADEETARIEHDGVGYLSHARAGDGRWRFIWTAPDGVAEVVFDVAANAANDDRSEFGDRIVVHRALSHMARAR